VSDDHQLPPSDYLDAARGSNPPTPHVIPKEDDVAHEFSVDCWCSPRRPNMHEVKYFSLPLDAVVHRPSWTIPEILFAEGAQ
jgi:hypothetical protein